LFSLLASLLSPLLLFLPRSLSGFFTT
jgi:hypothetical protein